MINAAPAEETQPDHGKTSSEASRVSHFGGEFQRAHPSLLGSWPFPRQMNIERPRLRFAQFHTGSCTPSPRRIEKRQGPSPATASSWDQVEKRAQIVDELLLCLFHGREHPSHGPHRRVSAPLVRPPWQGFVRGSSTRLLISRPSIFAPLRSCPPRQSKRGRPRERSGRFQRPWRESAAFSLPARNKPGPSSVASTGSGSTARNAPIITVAVHPVPVTCPIISCPLCTLAILFPSVIKSTLPVMARVVFNSLAKAMACTLRFFDRMEGVHPFGASFFVSLGKAPPKRSLLSPGCKAPRVSLFDDSVAQAGGS